MIKIIIILLHLTIISNTSTINTKSTSAEGISKSGITSSNTSTEKIYLDKICNSEPTCNLIEKVDESFHSLTTRNCMCDSDCVTYGDCCTDSVFYNVAEQQQNHYSFYCNPNKVYVKRTCHPNFANSDLKLKCDIADEGLKSTDPKIVVPVTNIKENITYANEYCALCNNVTDFVIWNINYSCHPSNFPHHSENGDISQNSNDAEAAVNHIKFNRTTGEFESYYNGIHYLCFQYIFPPLHVRPLLRRCVSFVSTCSGIYDDETAIQCKSFTSIIYLNSRAYRNKNCAICNGKLISEAPGCLIRGIPGQSRSAASNLFTIDDKTVGSNLNCFGAINDAVKDKFCP